MNSALNVVILDTFLPSVAAGFMGLVVILAASWTISRNVGYKILAGWSNWLLPTSWPIVGLGLEFAVLSLLGAVLTFLQLDFFKPHCFRVNAGTGSLFIHGGLVGSLNPYGAAFNMGNFTFVSRNSTSYHVDATENLFHHEAGHSLNLAAFGSLFHLIGVVDEVFSNGKQAFAERLAEGNAPVPDDPAIPMWGLTADRA